MNSDDLHLQRYKPGHSTCCNRIQPCEDKIKNSCENKSSCKKDKKNEINFDLFQAIASTFNFIFMIILFMLNGFKLKKEQKNVMKCSKGANIQRNTLWVLAVGLLTAILLIVLLKTSPNVQNNIFVSSFLPSVKSSGAKQENSFNCFKKFQLSKNILNMILFYLLVINIGAGGSIYMTNLQNTEDEHLWPNSYLLTSVAGGSPTILFGTYFFDNRRFAFSIGSLNHKVLLTLILSLFWPLIFLFIFATRSS